MNTLLSELQTGLTRMRLNLTDAQQQKLLAYLALLAKWNKTYNLTALRGEEDMLRHHLLDSLTLLPYIGGAQTLMDIGSGGGMPGIPAAICRPDVRVTLVDANSKKTTFLQQAAIELGLDNVRVISARVETLPARQADVLTSRAFAELADFAALTRHLLNENGMWAAMKGVYPQEEIERLPENVQVLRTDRLTVPGLDAERHMVLMKPAQAA